MSDEDFLRNAIASTDDDDQQNDGISQSEDNNSQQNQELQSAQSSISDGIEAEYGDENAGAGGYKFEKGSDDSGQEEEDDVLDMEKRGKGGKKGIFDRNESDSEVEGYLDDLENDEMDLDGLKLPSDAEEDDDDNDDSEDGPGLDDYDDEEDFGEGIRDDFEDSDAPATKKDSRNKEDDEDQSDNEEEIEDVFARAKENFEMDVVENLRK